MCALRDCLFDSLLPCVTPTPPARAQLKLTVFVGGNSKHKIGKKSLYLDLVTVTDTV